jgi:hypothetical protein
VEDPTPEPGRARKRTKKRRMRMPRTDKLPTWMAFPLGVAAAVGLVFAALSGKAPAQSTEHTSVPLDIVHVESASKASMGYRIVTPEWVIVADPRSADESRTHATVLQPADKAAVQNLAALCRIAQKNGEPITFSGTQLRQQDGKHQIVDGKPVLLARKIMYKGEEIILRPD